MGHAERDIDRPIACLSVRLFIRPMLTVPLIDCKV